MKKLLFVVALCSTIVGIPLVAYSQHKPPCSNLEGQCPDGKCYPNGFHCP